LGDRGDEYPCQYLIIALIYLRMESEYKHQNIVPQKCPVCTAKNDFLNAVPISQSQEQMIVHVNCQQCGGAIMVFVSQNDVGMITFGVMVDVGSDEASDVFDREPISADDVIALHRHLQKTKLNIYDVCK
jgi:hypothetical protein